MRTTNSKRLRRQILASLLLAGTLGFVGVTGVAQALTVYKVSGTTETDNFYHNLTPVAATYNYGSITNNTLISQSADVATGGGIYSQAVFATSAKTRVQPIITIYGPVSNNTVAAKKYCAEGGVFLKGANVRFVNQPITDNKAIGAYFAHGGAVATHYSGGTDTYQGATYPYLVPAKVTFFATTGNDVSYTGNDIQAGEMNQFDEYGGEAIAPSGGGFLSLFAYGTAVFNTYDGASITVGNETPATATEDSISSAIVVDGRTDVPEPAIIKAGTGTLTINSSLNRYYGTFTQQAGTVNLNQDLNWANKYDLQAGTLNLKNVTLDNMYDKLKLENLESTIDPADSNVLHTSTYLKYFNKTYDHTIVNSKGSLVTAADTTVNAQNVTLKDGAAIDAQGILNIAGDLSADASTVTAPNATISGSVSSTGGSAVSVGGSNLSLSKINVDNTSGVTLTGGTLTAPTLADAITGGGKVTLDGSATLATSANQIFTDANTTETTASANGLTTGSTNSVNFKAGTLSLGDDYSYAYLTNIQGVMDGLSDSTTELVMTGNLVDSGEIQGTVSAGTASAVGSDTSLDQVTVDTNDKNLLVGAPASTSTTTTTSVPEGFSVASLDMGDATSVTVTNGQSLTLGGSTTTDVIQTTDNAQANVALNSGSSLTIGNSAVTDNQALNVNATVAATDSTVTTNGQTTVTGDVSLTNSQLTASTGSVTLAKDLTTSGTSSVSGNVNVAGNLTTTDSSAVTTNGTTAVSGNVTTGTGSTLATNGTTSVSGDVTTGSGSTLTTNGTTTVSGDLTTGSGSTVTTNGTTSVAGNLNLADTNLQSQTGTVSVANDLNASGTSTITGNVDVSGSITGAGEGTTLNIGTGTTAAQITAASVDMGGGTFVLDPDWTGGGQSQGTQAAVGSYVNAHNVFRQNITAAIGTTDKSLARNTFKETGLSWSDTGVLSALYMYGSQDMSTVGLFIDGSWTRDIALPATPAYGELVIGDKTIMMVNGNAFSGSQPAALTNLKSVSIDDGAKLYIEGATSGTTYNILSGTDVKSNNAWYSDSGVASPSNVFVHSKLLKLVGADGNGTSQFSVKAEAQDASLVYGNSLVDPAVVTAGVAANGKAGDFFTTAADDRVNPTAARQVNALNSAASMTELAGVQHGLYTANNLFDSAVMNHLSDLDRSDQDTDIWAHYLHAKEDISGLGLTGLGGATYDAQYNGVIVGSDFYKKHNAVAGAAFTYIDGSIDGNTATAATSNDADYYGLSLYGRLLRGKTTYLGDISWLHGKNDITQYNSLNELTGSVSSNAFSAGVRAEQNYKAGKGTLTPYVGLRYAHLDFGDYTDSLGIHHDGDTANLWLVPVGLRYSQTSQHGSWMLKPIAEIGYLWTMGDRTGMETVSLDGTANAFGYDIADSGTFYGRLGLEATKGDMTYGIGYQYQKGDSVRSNTWMAAVRYKF